MIFSQALLIDEDQVFSHILSRHLTRSQIPHVMFESGWKALKKMGTVRPGVIVSELFINHVPIWQWVDKWRGQAGYLKIPVVVLASSVSREDLEKCLEYGINECLIKQEVPLSLLVPIIGRHLESSSY